VENPNFSVRFATRADAPRVLQFIKGLAAYERLSHELMTTVEDLERDLFGERPYAEVLFACDGDIEVGFAIFFHNYSTFAGRPGLYLEDLFVLPSYRGKGHGKSLMISLARIARERGCGRFEWSVLAWNEPAIEFYRSLGAVGKDEWIVQRVTGESLKKLAGLPLPNEEGI
jgi:GNAT superfamily N-acetyltransferase